HSALTYSLAKPNSNPKPMAIRPFMHRGVSSTLDPVWRPGGRTLSLFPLGRARLMPIVSAMNDEQLLERAIAIAVEAHQGQRDRYSVPYILHPIRVMCRLESVTEKTVGILHDVVEDTDWTLENLEEEGFPRVVLDALDSVTKRKGEGYEDFVKRSAANRVGRKVKLADLEDNMDLRRLRQINDDDKARLQKYINAWEFLSSTAT